MAGGAPPLRAYGALIQGYARLRQVEPALALLRDFYQLGGNPDAQMFDTLVDLCMRTGEFKRALQVGFCICSHFPSSSLEASIRKAFVQAVVPRAD